MKSYTILVIVLKVMHLYFSFSVKNVSYGVAFTTVSWLAALTLFNVGQWKQFTHARPCRILAAEWYLRPRFRFSAKDKLAVVAVVISCFTKISTNYAVKVSNWVAKFWSSLCILICSASHLIVISLTSRQVEIRSTLSGKTCTI